MKQNEILKKTLLHYINLEYYANGLDEEFQTLLKELEERCKKVILSHKTLNTKTDYSVMYKAVKEEVEKFRKELEERLDEETERIMNQELEFLDETYNEPIEEGKVNGTLLALGGVTAAKLLFAPIDGRDTTAQFAERTGKNILRSYENSLRAGYLFGQDTESIANQISNGVSQAARGMQSGIRTAIPSYAKTIDRIVFLNNNAEVVYCAVLDGRTCIVCGSCHSLRYKSIAEAPSIPQHNNCRCVYLRASDVTEPMPTYEEYINSLDEEEQRHILGENRYNLWKNYGIELKQFVNNGRKLRLEEINLPSNLMIENSGARSKVINILEKGDLIKNVEKTKKYYENIRNGDNKDFISRIAKNSGRSYKEIEQIVNHVFIETHKFEGGITKRFDPTEDIVKAFERLRTGEHTDSDILLLNHELLELTYMKNKKYNIYEVAHKMANEKFNWQEVENK